VIRWHSVTADDALAQLGSRRDGLTAAEARERLARVGPNALPSPRAYPWWRVLGAQLRSTVVLLLIVAAALGLVFGDGLDAAAIVAVLVLNVAIGFGTELPARRAIEALRALEAPRAMALRDGHAAEIDARALVPGDVIVLEAGAAVPADARLISATELRTVEAALTGEPEAARKDATATVPDDAPLAERPTIIYTGTTVADGHAHAVVFATGQATELGRVGQLVGAIAPVRTPLERRLDALGRLEDHGDGRALGQDALHGDPDGHHRGEDRDDPDDGEPPALRRVDGGLRERIEAGGLRHGDPASSCPHPRSGGGRRTPRRAW